MDIHLSIPLSQELTYRSFNKTLTFTYCINQIIFVYLQSNNKQDNP